VNTCVFAELHKTAVDRHPWRAQSLKLADSHGRNLQAAMEGSELEINLKTSMGTDIHGKTSMEHSELAWKKFADSHGGLRA